MDEYIKKEDIEQKIQDGLNNLALGHDAIEVLGMIYEMPAADVSPVRHGRWLQKKHKIFGNAYDYVCSECGCDYALAEYNYCPNCGAKMDLEE